MVAGRQQGKSVTGIRWLMEQPRERVLLTSNHDRRKHLLRLALRYVPGGIRTDVSYFLKHYIEPRILVVDPMHGVGLSLRGFAAEVGIDDAEEVLRCIFRAPVEFAAFNATLIPVVHTGGTMNGEYIDAEQTSINGIRPHRYPRSPEEHEKMKELAMKATFDPEQLKELQIGPDSSA